MNSLSVIIPVYNVETFLKECVDSILNELEPQDEIILINDGSKDSSLNICREYEAENVTVINNENHGVSYTRNCGVEVAVGDYVTFVDSDDYLYPGWREAVEMGMERNTDIVYFGNTSYIPQKKELIEATLCIPSSRLLNSNLKASACWYKLFKTDFIKRNDIKFDSELINGEDTMFCLDAILAGATYSVQKVKNFYYYRPNNASATHTFNEKYNASNLKFIKLLREKLLTSNIFISEEVKTYVDFLDVNGLCILAARIAYLDDLEERRSKYSLFEQPEYLSLYREYVPNELSVKRNDQIFNLLKNKKYEKAMEKIIRRRKLIVFVKNLLRRKGELH